MTKIKNSTYNNLLTKKNFKTILKNKEISITKRMSKSVKLKNRFRISPYNLLRLCQNFKLPLINLRGSQSRLAFNSQVDHL